MTSRHRLEDEIPGDQRAAAAQQPAERAEDLGRGGEAVEEREVVGALREPREHLFGFAVVDADARAQAVRGDLLAREADVVGVHVDGVHLRVWRAVRHRQRGVAERRADLDDAARADRGRERGGQRAVGVGPGAAAVLPTMAAGRRLDVGERIATCGAADARPR